MMYVCVPLLLLLVSSFFLRDRQFEKAYAEGWCVDRLLPFLIVLVLFVYRVILPFSLFFCNNSLTTVLLCLVFFALSPFYGFVSIMNHV